MDEYAQMAAMSIQESAANTLTFKKFDTGYNIGSKWAWVISTYEITVATDAISVFGDESDYLDVAMTTNNKITAISDLQDPGVVWHWRYIKHEDGTSANSWFQVWPVVRSFAELPGGGLIVPPNPLYCAIKGNGLASAGGVYIRIYFTEVELKADEYWELVQARNIILATS